MKFKKEELLSDCEVFNQIYEKLFTVFMKGISKKHKMEYYGFSFKGREIKGRAILPKISINMQDIKKRTCELFRIEYEETKCYPDYLLKKHFPEMYEDLFNRIFKDDVISETEEQVDTLVDSIISNYFID